MKANTTFQLNKTNASNHTNSTVYGGNASRLAESINSLKAPITQFTSPLMDSIKATKLCHDLGMTGKVVLKTVNNIQYVIFKGYAGQRTIFTGTRYLASNKKVVQLAVGSTGLKNAVKSGGMVTIVLCVGFDILEYILQDQTTMTTLIGSVASDLIKVGIGTIIATAAGLLVGSVTTIAAAPIVVAVGVGILVSNSLDIIDKKLGLTDKLIAAIDGYSQVLSQKVNDVEMSLGRKLHQAERELIYRMTGGFDIDNALNSLGRFRR